MKGYSVRILLATLIMALAQAAGGQEINVALASNGETVRADSEYAENPGGPAVAARLIDGVIRRPANSPEANRWHSELSAPHPHWVWIRFARPAKISKVTLWHSDIGARSTSWANPRWIAAARCKCCFAGKTPNLTPSTLR